VYCSKYGGCIRVLIGKPRGGVARLLFLTDAVFMIQCCSALRGTLSSMQNEYHRPVGTNEQVPWAWLNRQRTACRVLGEKARLFKCRGSDTLPSQWFLAPATLRVSTIATDSANTSCFVEGGRCDRRCTRHAKIPSGSSLTSDT
jgi:hypothetical protein